ncbi:hypothetical protein [Ancylobacter mangrovi]|uniref:hypothetical protein n=1 Tax=Ancylobacter mangrovi TaxID=2972472 RepID=UPI002162EC35|nr:hypothetical protein [Ancylobacter mangrovi]MCS0501562.1 hypothetical protein [Ancylobacter mangrovi]
MSADSHNALANDFVRRILAEVVRDGGNDVAIMVVAETVLLGAVVSCEHLYGVTRRASVERLNALVERVEDRLGGIET